MREAVSNTTLNNNTRSTPTIPWLFLLVCLLLLLVLSRNICRAAKQNTFATGRPAHAGRGKALFSHHSLPSGSVLSRPTPRSNHRPPPSSSHLSIATPLLLLLRLPFASRAVQNPPSLSATGAVSVAYHPHRLAVRGSVREKKPASHFRASKHPPSENHLPALCLCLPALAQPRQRGSRKRTAQIQVCGARQPAGLSGVTVTFWSLTGGHTVSGVLPSAPLFLGHLLLGCTPPSSTSLYHHHPAKEENPPPTGFSIGSGCLYNPPRCRLPTTTTIGPVAHLFSPLLIFAVRQVDSNSQSTLCVIYARSPCITP